MEELDIDLGQEATARTPTMAVMQCMAEKKWKYDRKVMPEVDGKPRMVFILDFALKSGQYRGIIDVKESKPQLLFLLRPQVNLPTERVLQAAEFICRANYGLQCGDFDLCVEDGKVQYRMSIPLADAELTAQQVAAVVVTSLVTAERYLPALLKVAYGAMEPAAAIREVER